MKIIFVTREGRELPGARIRCYNFAMALNKLGVGTKVFSYKDTLGAKDGEEERHLTLKEKMLYNIKAFKALSEEKDAIIFMQRVNYHSFGPMLDVILKKRKLILDLDDWEMKENPKYIFGLWPTSKAEFLIKKIAKV